MFCLRLAAHLKQKLLAACHQPARLSEATLDHANLPVLCANSTGAFR